MISSRFASLLAVLAIGTTASSASTLSRPRFVGTARVKQHMERTGELVEGEEHLLKIIVKWDPIPGATGYELCDGCHNIDEETGLVADGAEVDGVLYEIGIGGEYMCGGQPCKVIPGAPPGNNKYHLRVKDKSGEFGPWSNYQNFDVKEPGTFSHVEL
eukprot:82334_1